MSIKKIILIEDDTSLLNIAEYQLNTAGYSVQSFTNGDEALEYILNNDSDLILSDLILEGSSNGDEILKRIHRESLETPFILMTANGTIESAVECVKSGAWNYLTKPFQWQDMLDQIAKAIQFSELKKENKSLKQVVGTHKDFESITGKSKVMLNLKKQLKFLSDSKEPVFIQGESGTGKELIARALHLNSYTKNGPFVAVNCGAIVKELAEAEFFGYKKGAFTGANTDKKGFFQEAYGGTLFLDEITSLHQDLQVKLLRVLQEGEMNPIGQSKTVSTNIRLISATNVDLKEAVSQGEFREDLFYRISVLPIYVPPLKDRKEDLRELCQIFINENNSSDKNISDVLLSLLENYQWPGNVRELKNLITRLMVMNPNIKSYQPEHLPIELKNTKTISSVPYDIPEEGINLEQLTKNLIESALEKTDGNQTKAATLLGISRSTLIYRAQKHKITL